MPVMMKGRTTLRRSGGGRLFEPWTFESKPDTMLAKLETAYLEALADIDEVEHYKVQAKSSGKFTDEGALDDTLRYAISQLAPRSHRRRQTVAAAKKEAADQRSRFTLPIDKRDVYGLTRRAELRTWLRSLPDQERRAIGAGFENLDAELALAITEMPPALSGVLETDHKQLVDRALRTHHGAAMDELAQLERAIAVVEPVVEAAPAEIAREAGILDLGKFNEMAAPHVARATAPWVRKQLHYPSHAPEGVEAPFTMRLGADGKYQWQRATEDEVASGMDYGTWDEFRRAQRGEVAVTHVKGNGAAQ
jgi:hypothetical protein